jgi:hypothetical protein
MCNFIAHLNDNISKENNMNGEFADVPGRCGKGLIEDGCLGCHKWDKQIGYCPKMSDMNSDWQKDKKQSILSRLFRKVR